MSDSFFKIHILAKIEAECNRKENKTKTTEFLAEVEAHVTTF